MESSLKSSLLRITAPLFVLCGLCLPALAGPEESKSGAKTAGQANPVSVSREGLASPSMYTVQLWLTLSLIESHGLQQQSHPPDLVFDPSRGPRGHPIRRWAKLLEDYRRRVLRQR